MQKPLLDEEQITLLEYFTSPLTWDEWMEDCQASDTPEQDSMQLAEAIRSFEYECECFDYEDDETGEHYDECLDSRVISTLAYYHGDALYFALQAFGGSCLPTTSHEVTTREYDESDRFDHYSSEQMLRDARAEYPLFIDPSVPLTNLESESLVEMRWQWAKAAKQGDKETATQLLKQLQAVQPKVIDRCEFWDGFVIREDSERYMRALFYINPGHNFKGQRVEIQQQPGDFRQGVLLVRPEQFALCTICCSSKWEDDWAIDLRNVESRSYMESITLQMLEHDLSHNKIGHRGKINLDRRAELVAAGRKFQQEPPAVEVSNVPANNRINGK